jgi:serine/threonine-protein kinase
MAEIYRAQMVSMKGFEKPVAIKKILPMLTKNRRFVTMFLDEARLCMGLTHPNIVPVFDVGCSGGSYFLVMEYVDGITLKRLFQKNAEQARMLPLPIAAYIMAEVLKGLAYAHEAADAQGEDLGIIHRDVSPPNILLSNKGDIRLTDFGLAKAATQLLVTDPGIVKGKFAYLSPEAANGQKVDARADVFSAGIVLWEILTSRRLFVGRTDVATVERVRACKVPGVGQINGQIDSEFETIVARALKKDPNERFASAREFGEAITSYLFSHGLKVTNYDVEGYLQALKEEDEQGSQDELIAQLIEDELHNLSVLGTALDDPRITGAFELDPVALNLPGGLFDLKNYIVSTKALGKDPALEGAPQPGEAFEEVSEESEPSAPTEAETQTETEASDDVDVEEGEEEQKELSLMATALLALAGGAVFAVAIFFLMGMF